MEPEFNNPSTGTTSFEWWQSRIIDTLIYQDRIEIIFKEIYMGVYASYGHGDSFSGPQSDKVYKIVYSCKNKKWHVSERIYGDIIPPAKEKYEFKKEQ